MATAASPEEKFSCSVCLDLFTEPATIPCGHSFCLDCIGSYWDQNDQTGVYSCPQCRENFTPRQYHDRTGGGIEENESNRPKELGERQAGIEKLIEERLEELERLNQAVQSLKLSAQEERAESEQVRSIERIRTEVGELIGAKEKAAVSRADEQREQLEQEIQELRKRKAEMELLSETEDHLHFLQSFQSICTPPAAQQLFDNIDNSFWTLRKAVSRLKDHLEGFWKVEFMKATIAVDVTLDSDTANPILILSQDGKQVRTGAKQQPLPDNPKRFEKHIYVLGREGFTSGRHYWEVEVGENIYWLLGVTRESSQRKRCFTENPQLGFIVIWWNKENHFCALTAPQTPLPLSPKPQKLGVYLDYEEGQLSFYNVETRAHIYTFPNTFTVKLYPNFCPGVSHSDENAAPLIICPHTYTD
ncbi:E3 ubiquitin-protein ligase TRIM39-like [Acipenser ruthenus]|uniref:E3 ubiquitin-protein ligase TRIM39-like n=1 Tax=Acipenser ruthenus TaxID=7906 RepID=UPI002741D425|nr:E3 ubiquitin-protein ligase TRIM39-like [Acipenser ruthenus]